MVAFQIALAGMVSILIAVSLVADYTKISDKTKNKMFKMLVFILIIFAAIRIRGWDFENYKEIFYTAPILGDWNFWIPNKTEIGFRAIISIFRHLNLEYRSFVIFISSITILLFSKFIHENANKKLASLSVFFFLYFIRGPYGQMRQALAMAIMVFTFSYILNNKKVKFFLNNAIAFSIHYVSLIFLPAYFFVKRKFNYLILFLLIFFSLILSYFSNNIIELFLRLDIGFLQRVRNYHTVDLVARNFVTLDMIRYIVFSAVFIIKRKDLINIDVRNNEKINMFLLGTIIYNILSFNLRIASRISRVYIIFEVLLIPDLLIIVKRKELKILLIFVLLMFLAYKIALEFYLIKIGTINYYL